MEALIINKTKTYALEEVDGFGLLDDLDENKKQYITDVFNSSLSWLLKNGYITEKDNNIDIDVSEFSLCALPSLLRTSRNVNINENEINEILEKCYNEFNKYPFKELYLESNLMLDVESEFMTSFSDKMIEEYKK